MFQCGLWVFFVNFIVCVYGVYTFNDNKLLPCFPENKTGSYINFCSKNALGLIFRGCFIFFMCNLCLFRYSHVIFWLLHNGGGRAFT